MLRIVIEGERGEGATTLSIIIAQALRALHPEFTVEYHGFDKSNTEQIRKLIAGPPTAPGSLIPKRVRIIDNGNLTAPKPSASVAVLRALLREFNLRVGTLIDAETRRTVERQWAAWTQRIEALRPDEWMEFPRTVQSQRRGEEPTTIVIDEAAALPPEFNQLAELHRIGNAHARKLGAVRTL